ncbi:hypothetical protein QC763_403025 [Podospora pseudopauciseta]|uniref:Uncharacterized protein n=2 Tax=Podospora TaxID=5144 RepID=A0ABR0HC88_9PEZI|nr:hypothetical protein QC763_403025 [Podospora pseudopauciseta]KAK4676753.1 hypothetical protein QC764_403025 [Podospora pseudoanserina]
MHISHSDITQSPAEGNLQEAPGRVPHSNLHEPQPPNHLHDNDNVGVLVTFTPTIRRDSRLAFQSIETAEATVPNYADCSAALEISRFNELLAHHQLYMTLHIYPARLLACITALHRRAKDTMADVS